MDWIDTTVSEYCPFSYGKGLPKTKREFGAVPVYGSNGCVDFHSESHVKGHGIIIGRKGSVGAVHLSEVPFWPIDTSFYIEKESIEELKFTYYLLKSLGLENMNSDSAVPGLNRENVHVLPIRIPKLKEDREQLGKWISIYDDKIELNRQTNQTNQTLEQIAQAIFKSWFVDFEPVKAKAQVRASVAAGKLPGSDQPHPDNFDIETAIERAAMSAISGKSLETLEQLDLETQQQLKTTAALFPDALIDSELGEVPEGWEVGMMQDCCIRVESGGTPKRSEETYWGGDIKWLSSGEVRDVIILDTKERITEEGLNNSSAKLWPKGSTVVAMYGATAGQVCLLANEMTANQACCALIPKSNQKSYIFLAARGSIEDLAGKASGSAQQNLNKSLVSEHKQLNPSDHVLTTFETIASSLIDKWQQNSEENVELSETRDTLLPKLLSGELSLDPATIKNKTENKAKEYPNG